MTVNIQLNRTLVRLWKRKVPFFIIFFIVVLATLVFLTLIDFVPEPPTDDSDAQTDTVAATTVTSGESVIPEPEPESEDIDPLPQKIIFDSLDKEILVLNPASRAIPDLDAALQDGAVRHPDSADLTQDGNVFILGHSSYLPNVFNKNYQAFNGIQNLEWGDTIRLQSEDREYEYFVEDVYIARAQDVIVPTTLGKPRLTLATCNSFGSKDDRYIVEAKLVAEREL